MLSYVYPCPPLALMIPFLLLFLPFPCIVHDGLTWSSIYIPASLARHSNRLYAHPLSETACPFTMAPLSRPPWSSPPLSPWSSPVG
jgi:hypothetical protein